MKSSDNFKVENLPIIGGYNKQRFLQWSPEDTANWYIVKEENTKQPNAMFPTLGRSHINYLGINRLIYGSEPRGLFKSIKYAYIVVGDTVYRIDEQYNEVALSGLETTTGAVYFTFLIVNSIVYSIFVDNQKIYIYQEGSPGILKVTDSNAPGVFLVNGSVTKPGYIASFGNRIVVSVDDSSQFVLSAINLIGINPTNPPGYNFDPAKCFTTATGQVFAQEEGIIRQMGVLNNTLYIFTDYLTGIWSNIPAVFSGTQVSFPWKKNTTYNWNFGIANPSSLDIDFGLMVFLARNSDGLLEFRVSNGGQPQKFSDKSIDTLLQKYTNSLGENNPFLVNNSNGFLYQYENTIFYRMSGGNYEDFGILDQEQTASSIEFSFETKEWHRVIELNGERNRVQFHVYFNFKHLVTLVHDNTVYNMSGQYYYNEIRNVNQLNPQAPDSYLAYPFRYERITPVIYQMDYSEFETEYVQIDFVFGESNINYSTSPFMNAKFLISEKLGTDGSPQYIINEDLDSDGQQVFILSNSGNTPSINELTYNYLFKPSIELFWSDDGGISFDSADVRQFSQMGVYNWRMRWYQLGTSRNRVYKLVCVSPVPIVILGGTMNMRRISGGAN